MQFGRMIGVSLVALGMLLLFLQLSFFLRRAENSRQLERREHLVSPVPGILGGGLLIAGTITFFMARMEDEPEPKNATK